MEPLGIVLGIIAVLMWGLADFFGAKASRQTGSIRAAFWSQVISVSIFVIIFLIFFGLPSLSGIEIGLIVLAGFLNASAMIARYESFKRGKLGVTSPIVNSYPLITLILVILFLGESIGFLQIIGALLIIIGGVLSSFKLHKIHVDGIPDGVSFALVSMITYGILFALVGNLVDKMGWFIPVFLLRLSQMPFLAAYAYGTKTSFKFPKEAWLPIVMVGLATTFAFASYGLGVSIASSATVAPLLAAIPLTGAILARVFFKEKLDTNQIIGIVGIAIGIVLLAM